MWYRNAIPAVTKNNFHAFRGKPSLARHLVGVDRDANICVGVSVGSLALIIRVMYFWVKPSHVATRLRCLVAFLLMMCNALPRVDLSCLVVTNAPEYAMTANKGAHMKFADTLAIEYSSVCTVAKPHAANHAHPVTKNAADVVPTKNAPNAVHSHVSRAKNRAPGVVCITSVTIHVEKNVTALDAMPPVLRSLLAVTPVSVYVEKTVQHCVQFAMLRSYLPY